MTYVVYALHGHALPQLHENAFSLVEDGVWQARISFVAFTRQANRLGMPSENTEADQIRKAVPTRAGDTEPAAHVPQFSCTARIQ